MTSVDRIRTPLDYAREVLGHLPSQGIRLDILVAIPGLKPGEVQALMAQGAVAPLEVEESPTPLVEGEFEWL